MGWCSWVVVTGIASLAAACAVPDSPLDGGSTDATGECTSPALDAETLARLEIDGGLFSQIPQGGALALGLVDPAWIFEPVAACASWSVAGPEGVAIDSEGVLTVDDEIAPGTLVNVAADVESGRRIVTRVLEVYAPVDAEVVGSWEEVERMPCGGSDPVVPTSPIGSVEFFDNGRVWVAWQPIELAHDYEGDFRLDEDGTLELSNVIGTRVPTDLDGTGTARVVDDPERGRRLLLESMFLGSAPRESQAAMCGHIFE